MKTEKQIEEEVLNEKRIVSDDDLKEVAGGFENNFDDTPPFRLSCEDVACNNPATPEETFKMCCNKEVQLRR